MTSRGERVRVGDRFVDGDGHLWRVARVTAASVTLAGRGTETECPLEDGLPASDRGLTPVEVPDSLWARLGLEAIGRLPLLGDQVAFPAERRVFRVAALGPETVTLEVIHSAAGDGTEVGARIVTSLREYLEAWGEGTLSAPSEGGAVIP